MNYKTELHGWATEMAIKAKAANITIEDVIKDTEVLVDYAYSQRKDLEGTAKDLFDLVRNAATGEASIDAIISALEHIKDERIRQGLDKVETTETVQ